MIDGITIKVDDAKMHALFGKLKKRGADLAPAMAEIGEIILSSVERNLAVEGRYSQPGSPMGGPNKWQKLSPVTIKAREKKGHWPGKILQVSGQLAASISRQVGSDYVEVGTNKVYGAIHQFGGDAGRGRKVKIPARPYLVVQEEDLEEARDAIAARLLEVTR